MNRIDISLKNCYGIPDLSYSFDFSDKKPVIIYAPNGVMKTSFAKSFKDLSNGQDSKDNIFPDRITERNIQYNSIMQNFIYGFYIATGRAS